MGALPEPRDRWRPLVIAAWFAIGFAGIAALHDFRFVGRILFPASPP